MPGGLTRFGPAKESGEARGDQTGSVRMLSPAVWISSVEWPTMVSRRPDPSIRAEGFACGNGLGLAVGHFERSPLSCHFKRSAKQPGGLPLGLKNKVPS